jgi:hypothetical protein
MKFESNFYWYYLIIKGNEIWYHLQGELLIRVLNGFKSTKFWQQTKYSFLRKLRSNWNNIRHRPNFHTRFDPRLILYSAIYFVVDKKIHVHNSLSFFIFRQYFTVCTVRLCDEIFLLFFLHLWQMQSKASKWIMYIYTSLHHAYNISEVE